MSTQFITFDNGDVINTNHIVTLVKEENGRLLTISTGGKYHLTEAAAEKLLGILRKPTLRDLPELTD